MMAQVHLRRVTLDNFKECLGLRVDDWQTGFVATNVKSLAEAQVNPDLVPLAIYDRAALGYPEPAVQIVGFTLYELTAGIGYILRLMIDREHQRKGYGRAAMVEVIRRLKLYPEVEMIVTSHRYDNEAAANLYRNLGFVSWDIEGTEEINPGEVLLKLP